MSTPKISPDLPIETAQNDVLGRVRFSEACAAAIANWRLMSSLVIGVFGDWGSGKTSLKNLIVESLENSHTDRKIRVVEFNPWQVVSQEDLTKAFFDEISEAVGSDESGIDAANKLRRYSRYLSLGGRLLGLSKWLPGVPGALTEIFQQGAEALNRAMDGAADALDRPVTLGGLKKETAEALKKLSNPILVVLDDLDRLNQAELLLILQLVKANADFPNLIYLLLAQRSSVVRALESIAPGNAEEFLEKIIQVPLNLPVAATPKVHQLFWKEIGEMARLPGVGRNYDEKRAKLLFRKGLGHFFVTLRHVNRFVSTLSFHLQVFRTESALEVNFTDLIAIEVLRVFCEPVYRRLSALKGTFTDLDDFGVWLNSQMLGPTDTELKELLAAAPERDRLAVRAIIDDLFPIGEGLLSGRRREPDSDESDEWLRTLRICSHVHFDSYFQLALPEENLSAQVIQTLLTAFGHRELFWEIIESLQRTEGLSKAIRWLQVHRFQLPKSDIVEGSLCLADVPADIGIGKAIRVINHCHLLGTPDYDLRKTALLEIVSKGKSMLSAVLIADYLSLENNHGNPLIENAAALEVVSAAAGRLALGSRSWLREEPVPVAAALLFIWRKWDESTCKEAIQELSSTSSGFLRFLDLTKGATMEYELFHERSTPVHYFRLGELERYLSLGEIESALQRASSLSSPEESHLLQLLESAIARRKQELPDLTGSEP